jgi:hypothetical protein
MSHVIVRPCTADDSVAVGEYCRCVHGLVLLLPARHDDFQAGTTTTSPPSSSAQRLTLQGYSRSQQAASQSRIPYSMGYISAEGCGVPFNVSGPHVCSGAAA